MDKKLKARQTQLWNKYGLTLEEYDEIMHKQNNVCGICLKVPTRTLCVDHIHVKGYKAMMPEQKRRYVRGLLCFLCNVLVGKFERTNDVLTNRQRLVGVAEYFKIYHMKGELL